MSRRHIPRVLIFIGLVTVLLTQYQNCAKAQLQAGAQNDSMGSPLNGATGSDSSDRVSLIDRTNQEDFKVSFVDSQQLQVQSFAQSFGLDGLCSEKEIGAQLRWRIQDDQGAEVASDLTPCEQSGFHIDVPLAAVACGKLYKVSAQLATGAASGVSFVRACQPMVLIPDDSQDGEECYIESLQVDHSDCTRACYHMGRRVSADKIAASRCQQ